MRHIFLFFLLITLQTVSGQDTTNAIILGTDISLGFNQVGNGNYFPSITASKGKHIVFLGPILVNNADIGQTKLLVGLQTGYQIYPNGQQNRFNLFFEYDFIFLSAKIVDEYPCPTGIPYNNAKKRTIDFFSLENYFSYGFKLNMFKGFYFKTNFGVGFGWYKKQFNYEYCNGQNSINERRPKFWPLGGLFKVGVGYNFLTIK
jgi:hypothetical protein